MMLLVRVCVCDRKTETAGKRDRDVAYIRYLCLCSCLPIGYFSPYFNTWDCIIYHPTFLTILSAVRTNSTLLLAISVSHLCCLVMSAIHHRPEWNTDFICKVSNSVRLACLLLRRMTELVTLEVSRRKTHCPPTVSVRYVYSLQRKLHNQTYPVIAMQYLFFFFPGT